MQNSKIELFGNNEDIDSIRKRIEELKELIRKYDHAYYVEAESLISDREYDLLFKELSELEKTHPELYTDDSPTRRVGGEPLKEFNQVIHSKQMLSLSNTYSIEEVNDFNRRVSEGLEGEEFRYVAELKYDGIAISLIYEDSKLKVAATRGDGVSGDDITQNIMTIKSIPLKVNEVFINEKKLENFEVRGEVFMLEKDFLKINEERLEAEEKPYANPRNLTAGTLKQLDYRQVAKRHLNIVCYYLDAPGFDLKYHSENMDLLQKLGFPTGKESRTCNTLDEVFSFIKKWETERRNLPFQIDGIVLKIDSLRHQDILGFIARSPRWAIAYKYEAESAETILNSITLQVGRIGTVTPVAELEPVFLAGSTISRATLHNSDFISERDIRIGDTVIIEKGGEVIPKVVRVVLEKRHDDSILYQFPELCPCDLKSPIHRLEGEANYYCNHPQCPWQIRRRIEHFASRNAMNIDGLGEKIIEQFVALGHLSTIADIFELKNYKDELLKLDRWGEKSVVNLLEAIEKSKEQTFHRVLYAIGIRFIGEGAAKVLARNFTSIDSIISATVADLKNIYEIGEKMAESIVEFFAGKDNILLIEKLRTAGVKLQSDTDSSSIENRKFIGQTFVLTGELNTMSRNDAKEMIESFGGKVTSSVSKNTSYVVVGDNPGSKYDKALKLSVKILNEEEFLELISHSS